MKKDNYGTITQKVKDLTEICLEHNKIDPELYRIHDVKRGLRDISGRGVLTGLTEISEIRSSVSVNGVKEDCEGQLFYRGYNIEEIISDMTDMNRFGFEEVTYLLLFGELPDQEKLDDFKKLLAGYRTLPKNFVRDVILKAPSDDMMNALSKSVLTLHSYDKAANDTELTNVMRQCLQLIAVFPMLSVYSYQAFEHYVKHKSLVIHHPRQELSTAENILHMLRIDSKYTELEAKVLDSALVLHAEHGGGNNSTFTTHVVTSSGTDTYSAMTAALCSLKGPKHGGANVKVVNMFDDMKKQVKDWKDDDAISAYLESLLNKEAFDRSGLIYGVGHAVYSIRDPRAKVLFGFVKELSEAKGKKAEFELYARVEELAPQVIAKKRNIYKGVSANVDFYSGLAYKLLGLPLELYTPLFAIARVSGWSAHRMEELINAGKIIRPAYMNVLPERTYIKMQDRV